MPGHICVDSCFDTTRHPAKKEINCFACDHRCNLKCYKITAQPVINELKSSSSSNAVFLCDSCREYTSVNRKNRKSINRRTLNPASSLRPAPSVDGSTTYMTKADYENLLKLHDALNTKYDAINETSNKLHDALNCKLDSISETSDKIHDAISAANDLSRSHSSSTHNNNDDFSSKTTIDNIYKLMIKIQSRIDSLHTSSEEKKSMQQITSLLESKQPNVSTKAFNGKLVGQSHNLLNWSMNNDSCMVLLVASRLYCDKQLMTTFWMY